MWEMEAGDSGARAEKDKEEEEKMEEKREDEEDGGGRRGMKFYSADRDPGVPFLWQAVCTQADLDSVLCFFSERLSSTNVPARETQVPPTHLQILPHPNK